MSIDHEWIGLPKAAKLLGVSHQTVLNHAKRGKLGPIRIGERRRILISAEEIRKHRHLSSDEINRCMAFPAARNLSRERRRRCQKKHSSD